MKTESSPEKGLAEAELIVVAVRPQDNLAALGQAVRGFAAPTAAIVSIVAGVTIEKLAGFWSRTPHYPGHSKYVDRYRIRL